MSLKDRLRYPHDPEIRAVAAPEGADEIERLEAERDRLREALSFYASPDTYAAIAVFPDPPCGDFMEDFSEDEFTEGYGRPMPGATARRALKESEG